MESPQMNISQVGRKTIEAWVKHPRRISSCGGTRSGKTYSILQVFILCLLNEERRGDKPSVNSVVSETFPHLRKGAIRDFTTIMKAAGLWDEEKWNKTECTYTFDNGSLLEFFSVDNYSKVHGPSRDRLFINEAQNIGKEIARQLFVRTSGLIIVDYNPTHIFWVNEDYETQDNCITIHSTYRDNEYLTPAQVEEIESYKRDKNWWRVYGEGKVGILEGLIYPDFEQIDEMPEGDGLVEVYGMDFGFTNDPTAIVRVLADAGNKVAYIDEICYRTRMLNSDIINALKCAGVPTRSVPIYADCAEPKSIAEIYNAGFNIKPCDKSAPTRSDRLRFRIQWMQGWQFKVTKRSVNWIKEARNYTWAKDKDGNTLNYPIDDWNHAQDALSYALYSHFGQRAGSGHYSITIR